MKASTTLCALTLTAMLAGCSESENVIEHSPDSLIKVRISIDDDAMLPRLAQGLGYFEQEGLELEEVDILTLVEKDYQVQQPLKNGELDVAFHWFQHAVFGARHAEPIKAVMLVNNAPGMKVLLANHAKDEIKTASDFAGKNVAEGATYATKSMLVNYIAKTYGLPPRSYNSVMQETAGREAAVKAGLRAGEVDVMAFMEPTTTELLDTGLTSVMYDLTTRNSTVNILGAGLPSEAILVSPELIESDPDKVQRVVNAFVRAMRYLNGHSAEEIVEQLPSSYMQNKVKSEVISHIKKTMPSFANNNYAFDADDVALLADTIESFPFDESETGRWRATVYNNDYQLSDLYTNTFVNEAMKAIP